jgi:hypothetical protein
MGVAMSELKIMAVITTTKSFFISTLYSTAQPLPRPADWPSVKK